jgi:NAD(P)-dependent dehydrogenase (short-subunit alcohol dehydrogenase family)
MNIVITGASKGIGAELVKILCKHKGNRIIALSRSGEGLRKLHAECLKISPECKILLAEFDLAQYEFYPFLLQKIEAFFLHCDLLINNAGKLYNTTFEKMEPQDFDEIFSVNVKSVFFLSQLLLPMMSTGGHILNIGSMGGIQGSKKFPGLAAYSASKGAVAILSEAMAEEFKERGVKVNCLALGAVQTEMFEKAFPGQKALQTPPQIAQFIADIALTGHRYLNGKIIPVSVSVP